MKTDNISKILNIDFDIAEKLKMVNNKATPVTHLTQYINSAKNEDIENVSLEELGNTTVIIPHNGGPYDPENNRCGLFGGNQSSLKLNIERFINDEQVHQIISKYYEDFDSEDLELLFYRMSSVGCGYVAAINTIFQEYLSHSEQDFYDRFGFALYNNLGVAKGVGPIKIYNYEYLFLDFFLYYAKNERGFNTIEEVYGNAKEEMEANNNKVEDGALSNGYFSRTGMNGTVTPTVGEVLKRYLAEKGIEFELSVGELELEPGGEAWQKKKEELEEKGVEIEDDTKLYEKDLNKDIVKEILRQGKQIVISADNFTMYYPEDYDGNGKLDDIRADDVGSHAMSVVGTAPDGKLVVSTWGEEVLVDHLEIRNFVIYDYGTFNLFPKIFNSK